MLKKLFVDGKIQKKILPGSDTKSTISKSECFSYTMSQPSSNYFEPGDRSYVNIELEKDEEEYSKKVMYFAIISKCIMSLISLYF